MVNKQYFNCVPLVDDHPTFYDGVGFEFHNGTHETVYLALESNQVNQLNVFGLPDDITAKQYGSGVYDPCTVVKVRPNESHTLWDASTCCDMPNLRCDGIEGREIVMFRNDNESMPEMYRFDDSFFDFVYNPAVCCEEYLPVCEEDTCDCGTIATRDCLVDDEPNPCPVIPEPAT